MKDFEDKKSKRKDGRHEFFVFPDNMSEEDRQKFLDSFRETHKEEYKNE